MKRLVAVVVSSLVLAGGVFAAFVLTASHERGHGRRKPAATGGSRATCSPSPCADGVTPDNSPPVNYIAVTGGHFGWYVPHGLQGTAAVVFLTGCRGISSTTSWPGSALQGVLNAHRDMGIALECPGGSAWSHPEDAATPSAGTDTVYVKNVVNYVCSHTFGGVTPDCSRLYATGSSTGGHMTRAIMCSQNTVGLFRAVAIVGASAVSANGATYPTSSPVGACFYQADKTIFVMNMGGSAATQDPYLAGCGGGLGTRCQIGQTISALGFNYTNVWNASYLGCNPTPTTTTGSINGHAIITKDYAGCGYGSSPQFRSVLLVGGHHGFGGLDKDAGQFGWAAEQVMSFFDATTTTVPVRKSASRNHPEDDLQGRLDSKRSALQ
jgi:poly(3-hydroxybutyrate) depolymerase